jgi:hypothetical protein
MTEALFYHLERRALADVLHVGDLGFDQLVVGIA